MTLAPERIETPEGVTPIKPSEALRLGRLLVPRQISGRMYDGAGGACALGAIHAGHGGDPRDLDGYGGRDAACQLLRDKTVRGFPIASHIGAKNDLSRWSDDQIVAWLESLGL